MTIIEYLTLFSLLSGLHFLLTFILPAFVILAGIIYLFDRVIFVLNRVRLLIHQTGVDYLELVARLDSLRDDHARREIAIAEAGLALRARRLELRERSPE